MRCDWLNPRSRKRFLPRGTGTTSGFSSCNWSCPTYETRSPARGWAAERAKSNLRALTSDATVGSSYPAAAPSRYHAGPWQVFRAVGKRAWHDGQKNVRRSSIFLRHSSHAIAPSSSGVLQETQAVGKIISRNHCHFMCECATLYYPGKCMYTPLEIHSPLTMRRVAAAPRRLISNGVKWEHSFMSNPFRSLRQQIFPSYLGVDIGTTSIKMVEVKQGKQLPQITNYGFLESSGHLVRANKVLQTSSLKIFEKEVTELLGLIVSR